MGDKPKITLWVRQMARWHGMTPEEYVEKHGGEPEGLILDPGEGEPVQWTSDRVRRSPGGDLVLVEGPDGFKALRLLGRWTDCPPVTVTYGDADKFTEITDQYERFTLAREARLAMGAGE